MGFHIQIEVFFGKGTRLRTLFHSFHLPAATLHDIGKVTGPRTQIQQAALLAVCFTEHKACLASQHIVAHPMVHGVHRPLAGIGM